MARARHILWAASSLAVISQCVQGVGESRQANAARSSADAVRSGFLFDGYATAGESIPADVAVEEAEHVAAEVSGYAFARQPILSVSGETEVLQGIGETDLECGDTQEEDDDDRAGAHAVYLTRGLSPLDVSVAVPLSSGQLVGPGCFVQ